MEVSLQQDEQYPNNKIKGCILPWIHLFGEISGDFKVCCFAEGEPAASILGTYKQPLEEIWNGKPLRNIRTSFLKGKIPKECYTACYSKEVLGDTSSRISKNQYYRNWAKLQNLTTSDGYLQTKPIFLDIRFGNLCNFRCRMCGPDASTSWYKESPNWHTNKAIDKFTDNVIFWDSLDDFAPFLLDVYFAGGEPFIQDGHYKLLNYLIDNNYANKITLSYNSNLSYHKYKKHDLEELWSNFKKVKLWPSCEGFGKKGEYSRKGLQWDVFENNAIRFHKHIETISIVFSIWSVTNLPEFILWCKKHNLKFYITTLIRPDHSSVTCLPKDTKRKINDMYKSFLQQYKDLLESHELDNILQVLSFMNGKDDSYLLPDFIDFNNQLDKSRNENFIDTFPEFTSWYTNT